MSVEERAYVAGIVDGEGWIEFKRKPMRRNTRPGKPIHNVLIIRMEVPQVDGRLIDYLMATTGEGNQGPEEIPQASNVQNTASLARVSSRSLPTVETDLSLSNCKKRESKTNNRPL